MSLDGFIGDGHYDWSLPAKGSTDFITDVMRPFGTYLYGRKNFETMAYWETKDAASVEADHQDFVRRLRPRLYEIILSMKFSYLLCRQRSVAVSPSFQFYQETWSCVWRSLRNVGSAKVGFTFATEFSFNYRTLNALHRDLTAVDHKLDAVDVTRS